MEVAPDKAIITLTTDFGLQDPYAGQLKGALLRRCRSATIIDLTHAIPPWDVVTAAVTIRTSYIFFPPGTIHLIVVDPSVGGRRSILAAAGDGHFFIAPDNGILSLLIADRKLDKVHKVEHPDFVPPSASPTFHGRDIMAPVAAALVNGQSLDSFGPAAVVQELAMVIVPSIVPEANCLHGQVQRIDHFGNIRTTIRVGRGSFDPSAFGFLEVGGRRIEQLSRTYAEGQIGVPLALIDSGGYLEIAANQASAAEMLNCSLGDSVTVHLV